MPSHGGSEAAPGGPGDRIVLGESGIEVSALGLGTWAWGDRLFWGYRGRRDDAGFRDAYATGRALGVDFFDTAEIYGFGTSERLLGRCLREDERPPVVATKFFPAPWRLTAGSPPAALRGSLRRLGVARAGLYQVHFPLPALGTSVTLDGLARCVEAGLCRAAGVSNYSTAQLIAAHRRLAARGVPLATNQVEYSLLNRAPEWNGLRETCRALGVTLIAYSPLALGVLSGTYGPDRPLPGWRGMRYSRGALVRVRPLIEQLAALGAAHGGKTPAQVALNWVMGKGALPIPGARNAAQAEQNAGALGWRLTPDEIAALDETSERILKRGDFS